MTFTSDEISNAKISTSRPMLGAAIEPNPSNKKRRRKTFRSRSRVRENLLAVNLQDLQHVEEF